MRPLILPLTIAALLAAPAFCLAGDTTKNTSSVFSANTVKPETPSNVLLTLEQAWKFAENGNATLRQANAQLAAIQGEATDASAALWNNPKLTGEHVSRKVPQSGMSTESRREWSTGIEQTFEIAGQQGYRRKATQLQLQAVEASIEDTRRAIRAEVERRFVQVLSLQERIVTERQSLKIIEDTAASVKKRVAAGEDSKLDGNLAQVEAARAGNQIGVLEEQLIQARADLAIALQIPGDLLPPVSGTLGVASPVYTLEALLSNSLNRPLLRSLDYREQSAKSRLALERATRYPDLTVGLSTGREGPANARERLTTLTLSIPLPLFRNNVSGIGRASTELSQAQIERETSIRDTGSNINSLWKKLQSLSNRVNALQQNILPALEENQRLSVKSLQAGEIGLFQLLVVTRQVLDGRRDLIDAQTELRLARISLHETAGWNESAASQ
ncbi:MAG: TolC family protein [Burkholderiales bacterium]|nr:TolC family protein [Burkholderiales bacterium]